MTDICRNTIQSMLLCLVSILVLLQTCTTEKLLVTKVLPQISTPDLLDSDKAIPSGSVLKQVQVIFRDAARTPLADRYLEKNLNWSKCNYKVEGIALKLQTPEGDTVAEKPGGKHHGPMPGGCLHGSVTEGGYQQAVAFGTWLQQRYVDQFKLMQGAQEISAAISARSSYHNRSLVTLQGVLQGLLQPGAEPGVATAIPVVTEPKEDREILYANAHACKALGVLMKHRDRSTHGQADDLQGDSEHTRDTAQSVRVFLHLPAHDNHGWISWKRLLDAIMCLEADVKPLYEGMSDRMYRTIDTQATSRVAKVLGPACQADSDCQQLLRLGAGPLLQQLSSQLQAAVGCSPYCEGRPRLLLYSGHDSTLFPLLAVMGQPSTVWPPFMSSMVIELWQQGGAANQRRDHFVRVHYNFKPLPLPGQRTGFQLNAEDLTKLVAAYQLDPAAYKHACSDGGKGDGSGILVGSVAGIKPVPQADVSG